ncbi:ent-kaurene oxidase [Selaginella moellendorffii]|uniref:Ent-kaurene oxidase n=1 Tax=Selaginella moellendorffii TaxID=88036 RepID=D8SF27_SELML|nr:ent-kaurene oxidase [Selaginella moellendorffii]
MAKSDLDQAFSEFATGSFLPPAATGAASVAILHKHASKRRNKLPPGVYRSIDGFFSVYGIKFDCVWQRLPFVGNLLQMTVERPHRKLTTWSNEYGPIYTIRTGQKYQVIVSSPELAREVVNSIFHGKAITRWWQALVAKYSSISNRDLGSNITILTRNRKIVAMSDYDERYRMLKRMMVNNLLGQTSQKSFRGHREKYLYIALDGLFDELRRLPGSTGHVNARDCILNFSSVKECTRQVFGRDIERVSVLKLGMEVTRWEIYRTLVQNLMKASVQIDWRNFFPSLKWIPNRKFEDGIYRVERKRSAVTKALMEQHRELSRSQQRDKCYCGVLLDNESHFSKDELLLAAWEPIIESSDTTLVTSEWALYELARAPKLQEKLYDEIKRVVGDEHMSEDDLPNLPFLNVVIKETLRKYSPVPILPPRYIHEICAGIAQAFYVVPMIIASLVQHFEWSLPQGDMDKKNVLEDTATQKLEPLQACAKPRVPRRLAGNAQKVK